MTCDALRRRKLDARAIRERPPGWRMACRTPTTRSDPRAEVPLCDRCDRYLTMRAGQGVSGIKGQPAAYAERRRPRRMTSAAGERADTASERPARRPRCAIPNERGPGNERRHDAPPSPGTGASCRWAASIWSKLGSPGVYARAVRRRSLAVLLHRRQPVAREIVCDTFDGLLCNFWRALRADPDRGGVLGRVANDSPRPDRAAYVAARLASRARRRSRARPGFLRCQGYAGWWVWAYRIWIGGGWCAEGARADGKLGQVTAIRQVMDRTACVCAPNARRISTAARQRRCPAGKGVPNHLRDRQRPDKLPKLQLCDTLRRLSACRRSGARDAAGCQHATNEQCRAARRPRGASAARRICRVE